jgi:hypothetical protein
MRQTESLSELTNWQTNAAVRHLKWRNQMAPSNFRPNKFPDNEDPNENLKEELNQINSKLNSVVEELAKITALIMELQQDVHALSKE